MNKGYIKVEQKNKPLPTTYDGWFPRILNPLVGISDLVIKGLNKLSSGKIYSTFDYKGHTYYANDEYEHRLYSKSYDFIGYGKWIKPE